MYVCCAGVLANRETWFLVFRELNWSSGVLVGDQFYTIDFSSYGFLGGMGGGGDDVVGTSIRDSVVIRRPNHRQMIRYCVLDSSGPGKFGP